MTLKRFYEAVGGNYTEVLSRLMSDRLIRKFLLKFPDDPSYAVLCVSIEHEDYEEAEDISRNIISLPIDQRYDKKHMKYLEEVIKQYDGEKS